jgi:transposase|tara:strand:- start:1085 stop:1540 length:456 start_codon:yes stop_codon:yes gene_type:complete
MKPKANQSSESVVREIKRKTRRKFQSDEKIRIILDGLKGEDSIASICRREGISPSVYCKWSKAFLQAGKRKLKGDTIREAGSDEVSELRKENEQFKQLVAELSLKNRVLKKSLSGLGKAEAVYALQSVREGGNYPIGGTIATKCQADTYRA